MGTREPYEPKAIARQIVREIDGMEKENAAAIHGVRREFSKRLKAASAREVIAVAVELVGRDGFAARFIGYALINHHRDGVRELDGKSVEKLGEGIDSWEDVDSFATLVAGPAWREGALGLPVLRRWARSKDRWYRRAALASTVALNNKARGGSSDPDRTVAICEMLVGDRNDMVVKAMSWALRELAKRDADAARAFIDKYESQLAPRVLREVRNKLETGLKNPQKRR